MLSSRENGKSETSFSEVKVCGCCLGSNSSDANEIVECDGCGISVHEVSLTTTRYLCSLSGPIFILPPIFISQT